MWQNSLFCENYQACIKINFNHNKKPIDFKFSDVPSTYNKPPVL